MQICMQRLEFVDLKKHNMRNTRCVEQRGEHSGTISFNTP